MIAGVLGLLLTVPAFAQDEDEEEDPPPPPGKTFDVFDEDEEEQDEAKEEEDLPEGDAEEDEDEAKPSEEEEAPPPPPPPPQPVPPPPVEETAAEAPEVEPRLLVLVIGEPEDASLAQKMGDEASKQLAAARSLAPMTAVAALDPTLEAKKKEAIQAGRKAVDDGSVAFEDLDLEAAGEKLETAINAMAGYLLDLPEPARSSLLQGIFAFAATTLFESNTDQADAVFVALAVLEPSFEPEEGRYPSNVVDRFSAVKAGLESRPTGLLTVTTNPPGATVFIDGLERGASPVTVSDLVDGYHVVSVRRVGFLPQGTLTPVNGDNSATVDLELELSEDTLIGKLDRQLFRDAAKVAELAKAIGAEEVAVLDYAKRLSGTFVEGLLVKADGTLVVALPSTEVPEDHVLAGQAIAEAFLRAEKEKIALANAPPPEASTPFWEQWWFWAAVGGAAVVVATSAAVAVTVGEGGPPRNTAIFGF